MTEAHSMRGSTPLERLTPSRLTLFNASDASGLLNNSARLSKGHFHIAVTRITYSQW